MTELLYEADKNEGKTLLIKYHIRRIILVASYIRHVSRRRKEGRKKRNINQYTRRNISYLINFILNEAYKKLLSITQDKYVKILPSQTYTTQRYALFNPCSKIQRDIVSNLYGDACFSFGICSFHFR